MSMLNVVVKVSRCSTNRQPFGVRLEEAGRNNWEVTWAFPVKESTAGKEGYDRSEIKGSFRVIDAYPGCPSCSAQALVLCANCGKLGCWNPRNQMYRCPWCQSSGLVQGEISSMRADQDV